MFKVRTSRKLRELPGSFSRDACDFIKSETYIVGKDLVEPYS
jgi:hypothetical protein